MSERFQVEVGKELVEFGFDEQGQLESDRYDLEAEEAAQILASAPLSPALELLLVMREEARTSTPEKIVAAVEKAAALDLDGGIGDLLDLLKSINSASAAVVLYHRRPRRWEDWVASWEGTSEITLRQMEMREEAVGELVHNPNCPPDILARYAACPELLFAQIAAMHSKLPVHAMEAAALDERSAVREGLALNPSLPTSLIDRMLKDPQPLVRLRLTRNPALSDRQLRRLLGDRDATIAREANYAVWERMAAGL